MNLSKKNILLFITSCMALIALLNLVFQHYRAAGTAAVTGCVFFIWYLRTPIVK